MTAYRASPVDLRCSNFDVSRLHDISYQCGKELTCFFENVMADNETQFAYSSDRYVLSYKCVGFVNSTLHQLPVDLFKRYPNIEILYAANLGLKSVGRALFETANKLVDIHLEGNNLTGQTKNLISLVVASFVVVFPQQNSRISCFTEPSIFVVWFCRTTRSRQSATTRLRRWL